MEKQELLDLIFKKGKDALEDLKNHTNSPMHSYYMGYADCIGELIETINIKNDEIKKSPKKSKKEINLEIDKETDKYVDRLIEILFGGDED